MPKKTSNSNDKRLEILGVLFSAISLFIFISLLGHDASEEVAISPNTQINNPMGILGVLVSYILIFTKNFISYPTFNVSNFFDSGCFFNSL